MTHNEGSIDRGVRVVVGLVLIGLAVLGPHLWIGLLGALLTVTGMAGYCPVYRFIGVRTCPAPR